MAGGSKILRLQKIFFSFEKLLQKYKIRAGNI